ncbi:MAG: hypothetical protein AAFU33_18380 [Bacteroidota bacterium]
MENDQMTDQAAVQQVYEYAAHLMVEEGKDAYQVKQALIEQGLGNESAGIVVANLEDQIRVAKKESGQKDMIYGALWCVGGTVATLANIGFIFWGAIVFGGIQFIRGAVRYFSE